VAGADPSARRWDGAQALDLAGEAGLTSAVELLVLVMNQRTDGDQAGPGDDDDGGVPDGECPPLICNLGASCFIDALAQPLSCLTVLRESAIAGDPQLGGFAELGPLFDLMRQYEMVEWDGDAFEDRFGVRRDAQDCFELFRDLFQKVTLPDVLGSFTIRSRVTINRRVLPSGDCAEPTFVVAVPDHDVSVPGVWLEDLLASEVRPMNEGARAFARKVVLVPPVFVVELNRVDADSEPDQDGAYRVRPTQVLFPPIIDLGPIFGIGSEAVRVLRAVVVHGDSDGEAGHFWSYVGLGDRWWELK
jgi:hypothetical protein